MRSLQLTKFNPFLSTLYSPSTPSTSCEHKASQVSLVYQRYVNCPQQRKQPSNWWHTCLSQLAYCSSVYRADLFPPSSSCAVWKHSFIAQTAADFGGHRGTARMHVSMDRTSRQFIHLHIFCRLNFLQILVDRKKCENYFLPPAKNTCLYGILCDTHRCKYIYICVSDT